jgi:hypothetical protein
MQIRKKGDGIKIKSSPLKLLSQSQPNFAEMILRWSPFKFVSVKIGKSSKFIKIPEYMLKGSSLFLYSSNLGTFWLKIEQFWPFEESQAYFNIGPYGKFPLKSSCLKPFAQ